MLGSTRRRWSADNGLTQEHLVCLLKMIKHITCIHILSLTVLDTKYRWSWCPQKNEGPNRAISWQLHFESQPCRGWSRHQPVSLLASHLVMWWSHLPQRSPKTKHIQLWFQVYATAIHPFFGNCIWVTQDSYRKNRQRSGILWNGLPPNNRKGFLWLFSHLSPWKFAKLGWWGDHHPTDRWFTTPVPISWLVSDCKWVN